jgi:hypothetical protein
VCGRPKERQRCNCTYGYYRRWPGAPEAAQAKASTTRFVVQRRETETLQKAYKMSATAEQSCTELGQQHDPYMLHERPREARFASAGLEPITDSRALHGSSRPNLHATAPAAPAILLPYKVLKHYPTLPFNCYAGRSSSKLLGSFTW